MEVFLVGLAFVVVATIAYVALRNAHDFSDANEIVPGVPTNAPKGWAGAHSIEARLHRRIRDTVSALRANTALDAPDLATVRETLQQEALTIDEELIALAALPGRGDRSRFAPVEKAVDRLEEVVGEIVALRGPSLEATHDAIDAVRTRVQLVEEARAELRALGPSSSPGRRSPDPRERQDDPAAPEGRPDRDEGSSGATS